MSALVLFSKAASGRRKSRPRWSAVSASSDSALSVVTRSPRERTQLRRLSRSETRTDIHRREAYPPEGLNINAGNKYGVFNNDRKTRVGGLGVSGDTACADHEIAKRIRHLAQLDPEKGQFADDIIYTDTDGPSPFAHPICANTWRNN